MERSPKMQWFLSEGTKHRDIYSTTIGNATTSTVVFLYLSIPVLCYVILLYIKMCLFFYFHLLFD